MKNSATPHTLIIAPRISIGVIFVWKMRWLGQRMSTGISAMSVCVMPVLVNMVAANERATPTNGPKMVEIVASQKMRLLLKRRRIEWRSLPMARMPA